MSYGDPYGRRRRMGFRLAPILIALVMGGILAMRGCQEGPFGRQQIVALSPQEEAALGLQSFEQVLSESDVIQRGPLPQAVVRIAERLAGATQDPAFLAAIGLRPQEMDWDFRVIDSPQINAFCLPGGKVVVYTGIVPVAQTESGLATVISHEIGHALAHHGAERMAQQQLVQLGQQAVAGSMADMDPRMTQQIMGVLGVGSQVGILLPFSRKHESEADHIGILLMSAAGYDPREASRFWGRMGEATQGQGSPQEFMSTHPSHETRAADLDRWLAEAVPLFEQSDQQPDRPLPGLMESLRQQDVEPSPRPQRRLFP